MNGSLYTGRFWGLGHRSQHISSNNTLGGPPHPARVTIRDNGDYIEVLLIPVIPLSQSWGVHLHNTIVSVLSNTPCLSRKTRHYYLLVLISSKTRHKPREPWLISASPEVLWSILVLLNMLRVFECVRLRTPQADRIWGIWGSYYSIRKAIFYLLNGDYKQNSSQISQGTT